jgi:predicted TIM-barrel fold metal-dependent hydrolase
LNELLRLNRVRNLKSKNDRAQHMSSRSPNLNHTPGRAPLSRRAFLATGLGAVAAGVSGCSTGADNIAKTASPHSGRHHVDAHVHVWTPDLDRYPIASGFSRGDMQPPSFTPEELFAVSRENGVSRVVLIQMSFYRFDNSYMLDSMRRFPRVFSGVGIVDDKASRPARAMRDLARQGVRGFRINPGSQTTLEWLGSPGMAEMWSYAADAGLAICPLINPGALPAMDDMCRKFPRTRVVVDHFARIGVDGQMRDGDVEQLCRLARFPYTYVKTSAFYALGQKRAPYTDLGPMIRRLRDAYGASRLMWASDCPYQVQGSHNYGDSLALIRDRLEFLSPSDREWMLGKTAEKVFFS